MIRIDGSSAIARARLKRCFWPPESYDAAFADHGVVAFGHALDEIVGAGDERDAADVLGVGRLPAAEAETDVAADRVGEQERVLRHDAHLFAQRLERPCARVDAVALHRRVLGEQGHLMPWWPDDLPDFNGPWLAYGLRHNHAIAEAVYPDVAALLDGNEHVEYLAVWRRGGVDSMYLQRGHGAHVRQVFPDPGQPDHAPGARPWTVEHADPDTVRLTVSDSDRPSARIFAVSYDVR